MPGSKSTGLSRVLVHLPPITHSYSQDNSQGTVILVSNSKLWPVLTSRTSLHQEVTLWFSHSCLWDLLSLVCQLSPVYKNLENGNHLRLTFFCSSQRPKAQWALNTVCCMEQSMHGLIIHTGSFASSCSFHNPPTPSLSCLCSHFAWQCHSCCLHPGKTQPKGGGGRWGGGMNGKGKGKVAGDRGEPSRAPSLVFLVHIIFCLEWIFIFFPDHPGKAKAKTKPQKPTWVSFKSFYQRTVLSRDLL